MTGRSNDFEARHGHVPDDQRAPRRLPILAGVLLVLGSSQALAQAEPPAPAIGAVWGGCVLTQPAVEALEEAAGADVDYVVVYSRSNPNDGQPLGGGYTGPVICINEGRVGITALLTPDTNIPLETHPAEDVQTVELLAAEEAFILQYQLRVDSEGIEKRFCQTVGGLTDCFRIFPAN